MVVITWTLKAPHALSSRPAGTHEDELGQGKEQRSKDRNGSTQVAKRILHGFLPAHRSPGLHAQRHIPLLSRSATALPSPLGSGWRRDGDCIDAADRVDEEHPSLRHDHHWRTRQAHEDVRDIHGYRLLNQRVGVGFDGIRG